MHKEKSNSETFMLLNMKLYEQSRLNRLKNEFNLQSFEAFPKQTLKTHYAPTNSSAEMNMFYCKCSLNGTRLFGLQGSPQVLIYHLITSCLARPSFPLQNKNKLKVKASKTLIIIHTDGFCIKSSLITDGYYSKPG